MQNVYSPSKARENFFGILKQVNNEHEPVLINSSSAEKDAVIMSKQDYQSMLETFALIQNGQLQDALQREKDSSGWINIDDINWDDI
ncbi:MAG: type II toxin-antitoxin system Phd/YefM family antitoxin [Lactobacillaceae bacterium]|jgi:prevent-host-death family protein|nr:type II toxin-antitoxin system Phd/YefM family antitoxin [Lactobacillaceae bacterium]